MHKPDDRPEGAIDSALRSVFEPNPDTVRRVALEALAEKQQSRAPFLLRWVLVPALFVIAIGFSGGLWWSSQQAVSPRPESPQMIVLSSVEPAAYRIDNIGGVITVAKPNGQVMVVTTGGPS